MSILGPVTAPEGLHEPDYLTAFFESSSHEGQVNQMRK
jgi:hypothetical protein